MNFLDRLPANIQCILQKGNIESAHKILCSSNTSLQKLGLTTDNIKLLRKEAAYSINLSFISVKQLIDNPIKWKHLSFGCDSLDKCTKGGILTRGITEISGESSSGKTQIALQLSLQVQIPKICGGLNAGTIYICAGKMFQSKRLFQLIEVFKEKYPYDIEYHKNIFVEHLKENDELLNCILIRAKNLMKIRNIGLIIIDSIAEIYRIVETNYIDRANNMRKLANGLLYLIDKYQCAVVCINQVTSDINCGGNYVPSLGITWANLVRTRIKISKSIHPSSISDSRGGNETIMQKRKFEVLFTPDNSCGNCEFLITSKGITDVQK